MKMEVRAELLRYIPEGSCAGLFTKEGTEKQFDFSTELYPACQKYKGF